MRSIIQDLEDEALGCLTEFGSAHARASRENSSAEGEAAARQAELQSKRLKARQLGQEALRELQLAREQETVQRTSQVRSRQQALDVESVRSSYMVSLPPVNYVERPKAEEPEVNKVMLFDKATLFQSEYPMKEKVVKEVKSEETQQVSYFYVGCSL